MRFPETLRGLVTRQGLCHQKLELLPLGTRKETLEMHWVFNTGVYTVNPCMARVEEGKASPTSPVASNQLTVCTKTVSSHFFSPPLPPFIHPSIRPCSRMSSWCAEPLAKALHWRALWALQRHIYYLLLHIPLSRPTTQNGNHCRFELDKNITQKEFSWFACYIKPFIGNELQLQGHYRHLPLVKDLSVPCSHQNIFRTKS